jgi:hypothetical protein
MQRGRMPTKFHLKFQCHALSGVVQRRMHSPAVCPEGLKSTDVVELTLYVAALGSVMQMLLYTIS